MEEETRCCTLCFKPLHTDDSRTGADEYYQKLIKCCQKFLSDDHVNHLTQWSSHGGSPIPLCIVCYTSSEKLYRMNLQLETLYKNLEDSISTFSKEISSSRLWYSSQSKIPLKLSATLNTNKETQVEVKHEEINLSDDDHEEPNGCFQGFDSDSEESAFSSNNVNQTEKYKLLQNTSANKQNTLKTGRELKTADTPRKRTTRSKFIGNDILNTGLELRVVLERLSFNSKGEVIIPNKTATTPHPQRKRRKAAIRAINSLSHQKLDVDKDSDDEDLQRKTVELKLRKAIKNIDLKLDKVEEDDSNSSGLDDSAGMEKPKRRRRTKSENDYKCSVCSTIFVRSRDLETHSASTGHVNTKSVFCTKCPKAFYREKDCNEHARYHRFTGKSCEKCEITFKSYSSYKAHQKKHRIGTLNLINQCSICKVKWASMTALFNHMASEHIDVKPSKCDQCSKLFYTKESFIKHNYIHIGKKSDIVGDKCEDAIEWTYESIEEINRRVMPSLPLVKMEVAFKCDVCELYFDYKTELLVHNKESGHENKKKAKCTFCFKKYFRNRDVYDHKRHCDVRYGRAEPPENMSGKSSESEDESPKQKSGPRKFAQSFKCCVCDSTFKWARDLDAHSFESGHVNDKTFSCSNCPKKYYRSVDLKDHLRLHRGREIKTSIGRSNKPLAPKFPPFKCSVCNTTFNLAKNWHAHCKETGHVTKKTIPCPDCEEMFHRRVDMVSHRYKHNRSEPIMCELCGKEFRFASTYNQHMKKHTNEKQKSVIRCSLCEYIWATTKNLHDHMNMTHSNVTPFKCDQCERQYYTQEKFDQHKKIHSDCKSKSIPFRDPLDEEIEWTWQNVEKYQDELPLTLESVQKLKKGFVCVVCGQWFDLAKLLYDHSENWGHVNEKTLRCQKCDRRFYRNRDLDTHHLKCAKV